MTDDGESIYLPDEDTKIDWQRYRLSLSFHPAIKLSRREGLKFAEHISDYLEPEEVHPGVSEWRFSGGAICEGLHLRVTNRVIVLDARQPANNLEWYEHRFTPMLEAFGETFEPKVMLGCNVIVSGLVGFPDDMDARSFLGGYVMLMHPHKLEPIDRPLHVLGVRLFFPEYEPGEGEETDGDWSVNVRVESAINDTSKLFLEADAGWETPKKWDDLTEVVDRLGVVQEFMSDKLIKFLRQPPLPDDESDDDDDDGE